MPTSPRRLLQMLSVGALVLSLGLPSQPCQAQARKRSKAPVAETPETVNWNRRARAVVRIFKLPLWDWVPVKSQMDGKEITLPVAIPPISHGSGLLISRQGLVLTNRHVVEDALFVAVKIEGRGQAYPAELARVSRSADLAFLLLNFPEAGSYHVGIDKTVQELNRGEELVVLGYPKDAAATEAALTRGVVSRYVTQDDGSRLLQTSASINEGNSGGPAFASDGRFAGVVVAKYRESEGMGLVIPADVIAAEIQDLVSTADVTQARVRLTQDKDYELEVMLAKATADMVELAGRLRFDQDPIGALNVMTQPWQDRYAELLRYRQTKRGVAIDMMLAGILWNLALQKFVKGTGNDRMEAFRTLLETSEQVVESVKQQPSLASNSFVKMVAEFRQTFQRELAKVQGQTQAQATPGAPTPSPTMPTKNAPTPARCGANEVWSAGHKSCRCAPGYRGNPGGGCVQILCKEAHEELNAAGDACTCASGFSRKDGACVEIACGEHGRWSRQGGTCACDDGFHPGPGHACVAIPKCTGGNTWDAKSGSCVCGRGRARWGAFCVPGAAPSFWVIEDPDADWYVYARGFAAVGRPYLSDALDKSPIRRDQVKPSLLGPYGATAGFGVNFFQFRLDYRSRIFSDPLFYVDRNRGHAVDFTAGWGRSSRTVWTGLGIAPRSGNDPDWKVSRTGFVWEEKWRRRGRDFSNNMVLKFDMTWVPTYNLILGGYYRHVSRRAEVVAGLIGGFYDFVPPGVSLPGKRLGYLEMPVRFTIVMPQWLEWGLGVTYRRVFLDGDEYDDETDYRGGGIHVGDFSARLGFILPFVNFGATAHLQVPHDHKLGWYVVSDMMVHF